MGALAVEFLLWGVEGGGACGGGEGGAVVVALLPLVWRACHGGGERGVKGEVVKEGGEQVVKEMV